ncbi:hypothetical protein WDW37_17990 [Bdellovibrionota bacterium FG-1]
MPESETAPERRFSERRIGDELRSAIEGFEQEITQTHEGKRLLEQENHRLRGAGLALQEELAAKEQELELIRATLAQAQEEARTQERAFNTQLHATTLIHQEKIEMIQQAAVRQVAQAEEKIVALHRVFEAKIRIEHEEQAKTREKMGLLETQLCEARQQVLDRESQVSRLKKENHQHHVELVQGARESSRLVAERKAAQQASQIEGQRRFQTEQAALAKLETAMAQIEFYKDELTHFRNHLESVKPTIEAQARQIRKEAEEYWRARLAEKEREWLDKILAAQGECARLKAERDSTQATHQSAIVNAQVRLDSSLAALAAEKRKFAQDLEKLAVEVEQMKCLHPLRDCLRLTERELHRTEGELKGLHPLRPERQSLEGTLAQLEEQKKFLEQVIGKASSDFDEQARKIRNKTLVN